MTIANKAKITYSQKKTTHYTNPVVSVLLCCVGNILGVTVRKPGSPVVSPNLSVDLPEPPIGSVRLGISVETTNTFTYNKKSIQVTVQT
jgi:hypothetical protein